MRTGSYAHGEMDINFSVKKGIRFWEPIQNIGTTNAQFLGVLANTWFPWLRRLHNEEDVSCNLSRHFLATYLSERATNFFHAMRVSGSIFCNNCGGTATGNVIQHLAIQTLRGRRGGLQWLVRWTPDRAVRVRALAGALCCVLGQDTSFS